MANINISLIRERRSFEPGYRPGQAGSRALFEGEPFINFADNIRCIGTGDGGFVEIPFNFSVNLEGKLDANLGNSQPLTFNNQVKMYPVLDVGGWPRMERTVKTSDTFTELELFKDIRDAVKPVWPPGTKFGDVDVSGQDKTGTSAQLRLSSFVGNTKVAQWPLTIVMEILKPGSTEHCGTYIRAIKSVGAEGSGIFCGCDEAYDGTGKGSAISGPVISREIDLTANGADDSTATPYGARIMLDMVIAQAETIGGDTGKNQVGTVMRIGARPNEGSIKTVFRSVNATPVTDAVLDSTGFVLSGNAALIKASPGHRIALDVREDGGYSRYIMVDNGLFVYVGANGVAMSVSDAGDISTVGKLKAGGLNFKDGTAPSSTADTSGVVGDVVKSGGNLYLKTPSGWYKFTGQTF